ncbi:MAG: oxidoreductase [Thermoplasmatota archaeon]|nr:oxidoreductase [Candidatus Thermoplasmatota archaeon]MBU1914167.1 oxidoreductase [Candidatus Thermoplasmatota archaeon]
MAEKIKIAQYWGAGCGGCDVALLDIDAKILDVHAIAEVVFWPIGFDGKIKDIEAMPDKSITVSFYNGAIRNSENEHIAKMLRQKSVVMISFGSCACFGGTPGLANVTNKREIFETVYKNTQSTDNPNFVTPQPHTKVKEGELELPEFYDSVKTLDEVVDVDYFMPGCPPTVNLIAMAVDAVAQYVTKGTPLPPKGTIIASDKSLCDECNRERVEKGRRIEKIYQAYEIKPDPKKCLLDQGLICIGPATRAGCGAMCPNAQMPCRGCMGPTRGVQEQGASMLSALSSLLNITDKESSLSEDQIMELMLQVKDPLGTFYAFTLPKSMLKRIVTEKKRKTVS